MVKQVLGDDPFEIKKPAKRLKKAASKKAVSKKTDTKKGPKKKTAAKKATAPKKKIAVKKATAPKKKLKKPESGKPSAAKHSKSKKIKSKKTVSIMPPPAPEYKAPAESISELKSRQKHEINEQWEEISDHAREALNDDIKDIDEFGYDPDFENYLQPLIEKLKDFYFRISIKGLNNIPDTGRALIVSNHAGTIPLDGLMLRAAIKSEHPAHRSMRFLIDDHIFYLPFAGRLMNRLGAVRACQENGQRLLEDERLTAVFPEGIQGSGKLFSERYQLKRFGRGGFVKLALRTQSPILPVAIMGSEETYPLLGKIHSLAKPLGVAYIPITPTFPLLGPLGLMPLPSKWLIKIGEPIDLSVYNKGAENDPLITNTIAEGVRENIQQMVEELRDERESPYF